PGRIWCSATSAHACGWWQSIEPDLDRAVALGQNAHRMSIEWSRIEPEEGRFDDAAIARYREMICAMHQRGITPMITLHHFTHPRWLEATGGWLNPDTPRRFARFAGHAVSALGDLCQLWCTINEPSVYATLSYVAGIFPPGRTSLAEGLRVVVNMLRGHAAAAAAIRAVDPSLQVGIVHQLRILEPASRSKQDVAVAALYDYLFNGAVLGALATGRIGPPFASGVRPLPGLRNSLDFVGLNYYTRERVAFDPRSPSTLFGRLFTPPNVPQSDVGSTGRTFGEIYSEGLYRALRRVARLGRPIYITETGLPDDDDDQRPDFILSHMRAVHRALRDGIDVRGVFLWTLVDNFEWAEGWGLRFGLYALNEQTGARELRPSGALYALIAHTNALPAGIGDVASIPVRVPALAWPRAHGQLPRIIPQGSLAAPPRS
ncbi:MAG TPA: family 1 glycosylhydrolase, partial [Roseiflexaceae bacterium]|nr:family 1 glycosylhydrolase [Roseiflexaceae bacterium]